MQCGFFTEKEARKGHSEGGGRVQAPSSVARSTSSLEGVALAQARIAVALLAFLGAGGITLAQVQVGSADLPGAPAAQQQTEAQEKTQPGALGTTFGLLSRRSIFFPELAHKRGPLSVEQKLELAADVSVAPSRFLSSSLTSALAQARNANPGYGQGWKGYGKRFGSSMATTASANVFGTFVFASAFHQDPRYFVVANGTFKQKIGNALRRVVVTRTDRGGQAFNWSDLLGSLVAESLASSYLPDDERTAGKTFQRFGIRVGTGAAVNVFKEYWPNIFKNLGLSRLAPNASGLADPSPNS